jgi:hypothetical protein
MFATYFDAPEAAGREMERYLELGAEDVAEFARRYLDPSSRVTVTVVPRGTA